MFANQDTQFGSSFATSLPGYIITRAQLAERREMDNLNRQSNWLDGIGEMLFVDAERAFVIPAQELCYVGAEQTRMAGASRLIKLVISEDAGIMCTASGHVPASWLKTFSKLSVPKHSETERHVVKCFAPAYDGHIVGYHAFRMADGQLSWRAFEQCNGQPLCDIDFLSYEGKLHFAATTMSVQTGKTSCFVRDCALRSIKDNQPTNADWVPASWAEGHQVASLRGVLKDGQRSYAFIDTDQNTLCTVAANEKQAKVVKKSIKGILTHTTGSMLDRHHLTTVVTDDKIVHVGKDEIVACELSEQPALQRLVKNSKRITGVVGKNGVAYLGSANSPLCNVVVAQLRRI